MTRPNLRFVSFRPEGVVIPETMAEVSGWTALEPSSASANPYVIRAYEPAEPEGLFLWLDDPVVGWQYGVYMGDCHVVIESDLAMLADEDEGCRLLQVTDVFDWISAATTAAEVGRASRLLGLFACGPFDEPVFRVLAGQLHCHHADLQRDALIALKYTAWPEFGAEIDRLLADPETDAGVKADAVQIRDVLVARDWNADYRPA
jgi:hypothetical protein